MEELLSLLGGRHFTVVELDSPADKDRILRVAKGYGLVVQFAENGREVHIAGPN